MTYQIVRADPAKNITILVLDPVPAEGRRALSRALLQDPALEAEQAGFVIPPASPEGLWRLEMMGGEFCGNAARSFGLYIAGIRGIRGKAQVSIAISGMETPVTVNLDTTSGWAEAVLPGPLWVSWNPGAGLPGVSLPLEHTGPQGSLEYQGRELPVCVLDGIVHIIAAGVEPRKDVFFELKTRAEEQGFRSEALGVMFLPVEPRPGSAAGEVSMFPAVYVYATDSLVFESSCGSGSIALGCWLSRDTPEGERRYRIAQPGGIIETRIVKRGGEITRTAIGGTVLLQELSWEWG